MIENININDSFLPQEEVRKWKEHFQKYIGLNQHGVSVGQGPAWSFSGAGTDQHYEGTNSQEWWEIQQGMELDREAEVGGEVTNMYVKKLDHFVVYIDIKF